MKYKADVRYRPFKAHLEELRLVHATMSGGKQFHNLTKYEEEKETVQARGNNCLLWLILKLGLG